MEEESYVDAVLEDCREKMAKALEHARGELATIRTGRAAPALVEKLKVEYYGVRGSVAAARRDPGPRGEADGDHPLRQVVARRPSSGPSRTRISASTPTTTGR